MKHRNRLSLVKMLLMLFVVCLLAGFPLGYVMNVVKLIQCDFASPYKAEVIRGAGVLIPPIGAIVGYITVEDGP